MLTISMLVAACVAAYLRLICLKGSLISHSPAGPRYLSGGARAAMTAFAISCNTKQSFCTDNLDCARAEEGVYCMTAASEKPASLFNERAKICIA